VSSLVLVQHGCVARLQRTARLPELIARGAERFS
jgi:hypothetical protein